MSNCSKVADILNNCNSANLNLISGVVVARKEAVNVTPNATNAFLMDEVLIIDPDTGAYPVTGSAYMPIKMEWVYNSVKQNYEVVEGVSTFDRFKHTIGKVVISNSEKAVAKQSIKALNTQMWVVIAKSKGVDAPEDSFSIFGLQNGMKFVPEATSDEVGGRVQGSFMSIAGGEESTPNGVNWLKTDYDTTNTLYNQRLNPVIV